MAGNIPGNGAGGLGNLEAMMNKMNAEAMQRSMLNIKDQGKKEEIQGVNQTAKGGHDAAAEINRNVK